MRLSAFEWARSLFVLTVAVLVVFGIGSLLRINSNPERAGLYTFYAFAMFTEAGLISLCAWWLRKRTKAAFFFSILILSLNIFLSIFDQFGLADLFFVLLNVATLIALLAARREFLHA